jgi:hypothetical protein
MDRYSFETMWNDLKTDITKTQLVVDQKISERSKTIHEVLGVILRRIQDAESKQERFYGKQRVAGAKTKARQSKRNRVVGVGVR